MLVLELDSELIVKEISLESLPPCFEKWCLKFDDLWENKGNKTGFGCYLAGLLGESKRKNIVQITDNIEKFYREAKGWLGLKEYQMRKKERLLRHFILVFTAYTFIIYQQLMGGLRKRYANKPLTTFAETLEAFLTGISYRFFCWLQKHKEIFAEHKAERGFV